VPPRLSTCSSVWADVVAFDHRAQPVRGRHGFEASDAEAHHQHMRWPDGSARGRHLGQYAAEVRLAEQDGVVAGERGLARQRVHGLRARDAGNLFHREAGDLLLDHPLDEGVLVFGVDETDQNRSLLHGVDHVERRGLNAEDDVGGGQQIGAIFDELDVLVGFVREAARDTGTRLHVELRAQLHELRGKARDESHPFFERLGFFQHGNIHIHRKSPELRRSSSFCSWSDKKYIRHPERSEGPLYFVSAGRVLERSGTPTQG